MIDFYKKFSGEITITPDMAVEDIRRALDKLDTAYANRPASGKTLEKRDLIAQALKVFQSETSKEDYDRQLAEGRQKPAAEPPDPRQKERGQLLRWKSQAQEYLKAKKYDLAKSAIERALPLDGDHSDWRLYQLAARIYTLNGDYSTALRYINEAMVLVPKSAVLVCLKADIYSAKARSIAQDSHFSDSPERKEEYQKNRKEAFALYSEALSMAKEQEITRVRANVLNQWAWWLYFWPDQTDEAQARKDRLEGERLAIQALKLGEDRFSQKVVDACAKERAELKKWKQEARTRHDKRESEDISALEEALKHDVFQPDAELYSLAAEIYYDNGVSGHKTALVYADKALALDPKDIEAHLVKASVLAWPEGKNYNVQIQIMTLLQRAVEIAEEQKDKAKQAYTMGAAAYILYDRVQTDEAREKGVELAKRARKLGESDFADDVLDSQRRGRKWRARDHRGKKEYEQAASDVQKALECDVDRSDHELYWLAASIYYNLKNYDTALGYIDTALALRPKDVNNNALKGLILGPKAWDISRDSRFSSSSALRAEYKTLRQQELMQFQKAVDLAEELKDWERRAYALGHLAFALYFRPDALDPDTARKERGRGIALAKRALELGESGEAEMVLKNYEGK